jgi:hypothetical protein
MFAKKNPKNLKPKMCNGKSYGKKFVGSNTFRG